MIINVLFVYQITMIHANNNFDVDINTNGISNSYIQPNIKVSFQNQYEVEPLILFWKNINDGTKFKMGIINAMNTITINTYSGHSFFACIDEDCQNRALPYEVCIVLLVL